MNGQRETFVELDFLPSVWYVEPGVLNMPLLMLEKDDPQKELEFDVRCALEVDPSSRLDQWLEWNISMLRFIEQQRRILYGHKKTSQVPERK